MKRSHDDRPLRILVIVNLPWDPRLGAARVWIELADEWRKSGHVVEKFCLTDAFPRPTSSRGLDALRQAMFPHRAAAFVRRNADRFDVIDCLVGTLPVSKGELGFNGLLVARSVGLYRLYEQFQRLSRTRWPDQPKGRLLGTWFYKWRARRLDRNAERAIRYCDLLNLPNENEYEEFQRTRRLHKRAIVQPYGLNDNHRETLQRAAYPAEARLKGRRICFIGMWSLRKGARDWPIIMRRIWERLPEVRVIFLGTMFDEKEVRAELGLERSGLVQCIPTFDPAELPLLLADCAVGLFPSYIEGFGLAILEQLASGIPTVAYDVPGPRQILSPQRTTLLTAEGDAGTMADRAVQILEMKSTSYAVLSAQCVFIANQYRWSQIADSTIDSYRKELGRLTKTIVFTQPFSLAAAGGGPRILRSLLQDAPVATVCVCTAPSAPAANYLETEQHIPLRPSLGRIERTRFSSVARAITPLFYGRFSRKLEDLCRRNQARAIHAIAHGGLDFYYAYLVSQRLEIPLLLQIHDDLVYTAAGRVPAEKINRCLAEVWQNAQARFVISNELGEEYARRYGARDFVTITDGVDSVPAKPRGTLEQFRIYFMGLFHLGYEQNLSALIEAVKLIPNDVKIKYRCSITLRCDYIRPSIAKQSSILRVLPFGTEADVKADLASADCLYLPLHFDNNDQSFGAYSLSTKMVTYLGSGIPILYHGPSNTAAYNLLQKHEAAALVTSINPETIRDGLLAFLDGSYSSKLAGNALDLARSSFRHSEQHAKFWNFTLGALEQFDCVRRKAQTC